MLDILKNLISLKHHAQKGIQPSGKLLGHIKTATWIQSFLKREYPVGHFPSLSFKSFWQLTLDVNKVESIPDEPKNFFLDISLWHSFKSHYPIYVALFYPYIDPDIKSTSPSLANAIIAHNFVKAQALTLHANHLDALKLSSTYSLSFGLIKSIQQDCYAHFNTQDYLAISSAKDAWGFLNRIRVGKGVSNQLEDQLTFKLGSTQLEHIDTALAKVKSYFKHFFGGLGKDNTQKRGEDLSKRAEYSRKMGLLLSSESKKRFHIYTHSLVLGSDKKTTQVKFLNEVLSPSQKTDVSGSYEDHSDDLVEEVYSPDLIWIEHAECDHYNPVAL